MVLGLLVMSIRSSASSWAAKPVYPKVFSVTGDVKPEIRPEIRDTHALPGGGDADKLGGGPSWRSAHKPRVSSICAPACG
jgi:hypothetical protein